MKADDHAPLRHASPTSVSGENELKADVWGAVQRRLEEVSGENELKGEAVRAFLQFLRTSIRRE